jgi:hypothetical protein
MRTIAQRDDIVAAPKTGEVFAANGMRFAACEIGGVWHGIAVHSGPGTGIVARLDVIGPTARGSAMRVRVMFGRDAGRADSGVMFGGDGHVMARADARVFAGRG